MAGPKLAIRLQSGRPYEGAQRSDGYVYQKRSYTTFGGKKKFSE